ncbi:MAG: Cof-type HAD-IIB family hydrolase [Tepidiformaceae bacterium]
MSEHSPTPGSEIRLFLADVDGALVTKDKILTPRAAKAVRDLEARGIAFAITSGRPPRGMAMLIEPLSLKTPIGAFNGGMFIKPDLSIIDQHNLPDEVVPKVIETMREGGLDVWLYRGTDWFIQKKDAPHVDREAWTVKFPPTVVASYGDIMTGVVKIVGISDDLDAVARCEAAAQTQFGSHVTAARSQPYYLDVTHPDANKGAVARRLSQSLNIPLEQIATIGDQMNDTLMFKVTGMSIAMGNASDEVKALADYATASFEDDGFAKAVEKYVLGAD